MEFIITAIIPTVIITIVALGLFKVIKLTLKAFFIALFLVVICAVYTLWSDIDLFSIDFSGLADTVTENAKNAVNK